MADLRHDEAAQNALNIRLKSQPWYQAFLRQAGQNPARVQLSKDQRKQLAAVAVQNGVPLPEHVGFDPSGNVNDFHGFSSQPAWLKAIEIAAPIAVGGYFAAPALFGGAASGGAAAAGSSIPTLTTLTGAPIVAGGTTAAAGGASLATTAGVAGAAGTGFHLGKTLLNLAPQGINAGTQLLAQRSANSANQRATDAQLAENQRAQDYLERRDAQQRQDFLDTQNRNFGLYNESQARLDPYRRFGLRSLDQLSRPIPGVGTLAARMG